MGDAGGAASGEGGVWLMCYFLHRYLDFRVSETESLAELAGAGGQIAWRAPDGGDEHSPFWRLRVPHLGVAEAIMRRSVLARVMLHIWGEGDTLQDAVAAAVATHDASREPFLAADTTFRVIVDGFGCTHSQEQQLEMHHVMEPIPFLGRVDLKAPQHVFWVVEVGPPTPSLPSAPRRFYIGRQVGASDRVQPLRALDLKTRRFLGPTTMDHEMSLIMCNMGLARPGALVYDPFVGTGSILLAAALRGALTMGCDIDLKLLREGKADVHNGRVRSDGRVTVWSNFADAGLPPPLALLRADLAAPPFRGPAALGGWAHALICDPPYGVRAGGRKSGGRRPGGRPVKPVPEHLRAAHIPSTAFYPLAECMADLMDTAAHALVLRGRLVYFFPVALSEDSEDGLPRHPCLELVANCRQVLSTNFARRLVTMRKVREWYPEAKAEAAAALAEAPHGEAATRVPGVLDPRGKRCDADGNDVPPPAIAKHRGKRT